MLPSVCPACRAVRPLLIAGPIAIDLIERRVVRAGRPVALRQREYALLVMLARHAGSVVGHARLLEEVWRLRCDPGTNVVAVHMSRLRAAIDRAGEPPLLRTVRGRGYMLDAGVGSRTVRGCGYMLDAGVGSA